MNTDAKQKSLERVPTRQGTLDIAHRQENGDETIVILHGDRWIEFPLDALEEVVSAMQAVRDLLYPSFMPQAEQLSFDLGNT